MNKITSKEKIIIGALSIIFIAVFGGMMRDLYGKKTLPTSQNQVAIPAINIDTPIPSVTDVNQKSQTKKIGAQGSQNSEKKTDTSIVYSSYSTCLENTKDERASKDCCDCLGGDASLHKACRDAAATYDFSKNTTFKTFTIPSILGRDGDYSKFTTSGNQQQCKQACESASSGLACGDYQYCRTACNNLAQ